MAYTQAETAVLLEFGRRVREVREALEWSQEDLARKAALDRTYVGAIERGKRNVSLLNINRLACVLYESFDDFFPFRPTPIEDESSDCGM